MNCYFCNFYLDIGLTCGMCKNLTDILPIHYLNSENKLYGIVMVPIPNYKDVEVSLMINENKTFLQSRGKLLITLSGLVINPDNFKIKVPLYLTLG